MMNIESKLWKLESFNGAYVHILQKASGAMHTVSRGTLPSDNALAMMHEKQFDKVCREAFHGEN